MRLIEPVCKQLICMLRDGVSQSDCIIDGMADCVTSSASNGLNSPSSTSW